MFFPLGVWTEEQREFIKKHLASFIRTLKTPGKTECGACIEKGGDIFNGRSWKDIKFFVYNHNTSVKKKTRKL